MISNSNGRIIYSKSLKIITLLLLFLTLNAGLLSSIQGLGVFFYAITILLAFYLFTVSSFKLKKYITVCLMIFLWLIFLTLFSNRATFAGLYAYFLGVCILFFISLLNFEKKKDVLFYVNFLVGLSFYFALLFILFEIFTGFHLPISRFIKDNLSSNSNVLGLHIPTYIFTNENDLSAFIIISFFLLRSFNKKNLYFDITLSPIVFFIIFVSSSRLCLLIFVFYYLFIIVSKLKKLKKPIFIFVSIFILLFTIKNFNTIFSSGSLLIRLNLVLLALSNIINEKNIFGYGPSSFPSIVNDSLYTAEIINPHNFFIEIAVEAGVFVLLLYLFFSLSFVMKEKNKYITVSFIVFFVCNLCSSSFVPILWNWFFLGFYLKYYYRNVFDGEKNYEKY